MFSLRALRPIASTSALGTVAPSTSRRAVSGVRRCAAGAGARRGISQSAAPQKALPFALNTTRAETAQGEDASGVRQDGKMLRMIMFGASLVTS